MLVFKIIFISRLYFKRTIAMMIRLEIHSLTNIIINTIILLHLKNILISIFSIIKHPYVTKLSYYYLKKMIFFV